MASAGFVTADGASAAIDKADASAKPAKSRRFFFMRSEQRTTFFPSKNARRSCDRREARAASHPEHDRALKQPPTCRGDAFPFPDQMFYSAAIAVTKAGLS